MRIEIMFCENITFIFGNGLHYLLPKNIGCFFARTGLYMHFKIQPGTSHSGPLTFHCTQFNSSNTSYSLVISDARYSSSPYKLSPCSQYAQYSTEIVFL